MNRLTNSLIALSMCAAVGAYAGPIDDSGWRGGPSEAWFVNWDKALAEAKKTNRKLFVLNTGSDWCHWCKKLREEVLEKPDFKKFAARNLVLVYLDNPRMNPLGDAQRAHNRQIAKALAFGGGVPSAGVFTVKGKKLGAIGGGGLAVDAYIDRLKGILKEKGQYFGDDDARTLFTDGYGKMAEEIGSMEDAEVSAGAEKPVEPHVSKDKLHAFYRSKDRKHVFVEVFHNDEGDAFTTPRLTLDRVREMMAAKVDIMVIDIACSKDGVLFASPAPGKRADLAKTSDGTGSFEDHDAVAIKRLKVRHRGRLAAKGFATFEELLKAGKGRMLFKINPGWPPEYVRQLESLLDRLDAWESVIMGVGNVKDLTKYGGRIFGKMKSGELCVACQYGCFPEVSKIVAEATAVGTDRRHISEENLRNVPQRVYAAMFYCGRTDDEAEWKEALEEGITVFRTHRPQALIKYLTKCRRRR